MRGGLRIVFPMKVERKASVVAPAAPVANTGDSPVVALIRRIEERCYADLVEACRYVSVPYVVAPVAHTRDSPVWPGRLVYFKIYLSLM